MLLIEEAMLIISLEEAMIHSVLLEVEELQFLTKGIGESRCHRLQENF